MKIIKRSKALQVGLLKYYTGKPCPKGHIAERYVKNRVCTECREPNSVIKERMKQFRLTPLGRYNSYKQGAAKRGLEFTLTLEDFNRFWQEPCAYCGEDIQTIGLDRMVNSKGYTLDNVCLCCWDCNNMKSDKDALDWLGAIRRIAKKDFENFMIDTKYQNLSSEQKELFLNEWFNEH